jgi:hypothetical protein
VESGAKEEMDKMREYGVQVERTRQEKRVEKRASQHDRMGCSDGGSKKVKHDGRVEGIDFRTI